MRLRWVFRCLFPMLAIVCVGLWAATEGWHCLIYAVMRTPYQWDIMFDGGAMVLGVARPPGAGPFVEWGGYVMHPAGWGAPGKDDPGFGGFHFRSYRPIPGGTFAYGQLVIPLWFPLALFAGLTYWVWRRKPAQAASAFPMEPAGRDPACSQEASDIN